MLKPNQWGHSIPFFMMNKIDNFVWAEKYRPSTINECILPSAVKAELNQFVDQQSIPHLLFSGTAGTGKTTAAKAIASQLGADLLYINASKDNGIDVMRNKIVQFASTASFENNLKIVLCDEADFLSANAQASLRGITEEFSKTTRFILTCNFKNRIIDPLHSRTTPFDFKIPESEKKDLTAQMCKRVVQILKQESVEHDVKAVITLVQKFFPDFRKTLNELQRYSSYGKIDSGILVTDNTSYEDLIKSMKEKKFGDVRKWVARNSDLASEQLFRYFYDNLSMFEGKTIPTVVLLLAQYQFWSSSVIDQEINNIAALTEIMGVAEWKN